MLSPHINLCLPSIQISPCLVNGSSISWSASSTSKLSSFEPDKSFNISSTSSESKPVKETSKSSVFNSSNNTSNFSVSHSPLILFNATFNAFSFALSKSTIIHSTSSNPNSCNTFNL